MKKVYFYDKETFEYTGCADAPLDPLETKLAKEEVYLLPANATFVEPPELKEYEVAVYNSDDSWTKRTSFKGNYKLNLNTGRFFKINDNSLLKSYEILVTPEVMADAQKNPIKYMIIDKKLVDISKTQKYQALYNKKSYEVLIKKVQDDFDTFVVTPVKYKGMEFLPGYVDKYAALSLRAFPQEIWDCHGTKSKVMGKQEFDELRNFLEGVYNKAYKEKKEKIKKYKTEIEKLEAGND